MILTEIKPVAVVMATMNRCETVVSCVQALARQTELPAMVVITDNGSTDGTLLALRELRGLPFELKVLQAPENLGNAGGVEHGLAFAFAHGANSCWILDDDSWPADSALAALIEDCPERTVRHSLQVNPANGNLTWPQKVCGLNDSIELVMSPSALKGDFIETDAAWTGALLPRQAYELAGPVMSELFIRGEDEDYPLRIKDQGFRFELAVKSVLHHPGPSELIYWKLFGKHLFHEPGLPEWKLYYKVRNMVWLKRKRAGMCSALLMVLGYGCIILKRDGWSRLSIWWKAVVDGMKGRLGRKNF